MNGLRRFDKLFRYLRNSIREIYVTFEKVGNKCYNVYIIVKIYENVIKATNDETLSKLYDIYQYYKALLEVLSDMMLEATGTHPRFYKELCLTDLKVIRGRY